MGQSPSKADTSLQPLHVTISLNFDPVSPDNTALRRKSQHSITTAQESNGMCLSASGPPLSQTVQSTATTVACFSRVQAPPFSHFHSLR